MTVKLVDFEVEEEDDVQFGTCELCFSTGSTRETLLIFENENKEKLTISSGMWDWGDYYELFSIGNLIHFAEYFNKEIKIKTLLELDEKFMDIFSEYDEKYQMY